MIRIGHKTLSLHLIASSWTKIITCTHWEYRRLQPFKLIDDWQTLWLVVRITIQSCCDIFAMQIETHWMHTIACQDRYINIPDDLRYFYPVIWQQMTLMNIFVMKYRNKAERWSRLPTKMLNFLDRFFLGLIRILGWLGNFMTLITLDQIISWRLF